MENIMNISDVMLAQANGVENPHQAKQVMEDWVREGWIYIGSHCVADLACDICHTLLMDWRQRAVFNQASAQRTHEGIRSLREGMEAMTAGMSEAKRATIQVGRDVQAVMADSVMA